MKKFKSPQREVKTRHLKKNKRQQTVDDGFNIWDDRARE
jgi:hypothetical protein